MTAPAAGQAVPAAGRAAPAGQVARDREALRDAATQIVQQWCADSGVPYEAGARAGEYVVELPGEAKLKTGVSLLAGDRAVSATAFVIRRPDENHAAFYRWLLTRNTRLPGVAFALDRLGDIYLVGRIPLAGVTADTLDDLLGAILTASDGSFNDLLALGFLSSMRREWAWRLDRGESTRNLDAFRHLLEGTEPEGTEPEDIELPGDDHEGSAAASEPTP